jgi:putative hemin transport protein
MIEPTPEALRERWNILLKETPRLRIRDAAEQLGVSEAQLLALGSGETSTRLRGDWADLLLELHRLGPLMGLTRNDHAVHERHGGYGAQQVMGPTRLIEDGGFTAALFLDHWHHGFAVSESGHGQVRRSLQFFDRFGQAVHKIYLTEHSREEPFQEIVDTFRAADQAEILNVENPLTATSLDMVDRLWSSAGLSGGSRTGDHSVPDHPDLAIDLPTLRVRALSQGTAETVLMVAAERGTEVVIAVGNRGTLQMHRGPIHKILRTGPWINVLDDPFNLHLRDTQIASGWHVEEDGGTGQAYLCWCDCQHQPILQISSEDRSGSWADCLEAACKPAREAAA